MDNDRINDKGKVTLSESQTLTEEKSYRCSFCGKDVNEVFLLVAGPAVSQESQTFGRSVLHCFLSPEKIWFTGVLRGNPLQYFAAYAASGNPDQYYPSHQSQDPR